MLYAQHIEEVAFRFLIVLPPIEINDGVALIPLYTLKAMVPFSLIEILTRIFCYLECLSASFGKLAIIYEYKIILRR